MGNLMERLKDNKLDNTRFNDFVKRVKSLLENFAEKQRSISMWSDELEDGVKEDEVKEDEDEVKEDEVEEPKEDEVKDLDREAEEEEENKEKFDENDLPEPTEQEENLST